MQIHLKQQENKTKTTSKIGKKEKNFVVGFWRLLQIVVSLEKDYKCFEKCDALVESCEWPILVYTGDGVRINLEKLA